MTKRAYLQHNSTGHASSTLLNTDKNFFIFSILLATLYGIVGFISNGFDDEFYNIKWINQYGAKVFFHIQTIDVHPPLSYFLDYLLFTLFKNWNWVRLFISLITASSIIYAVYTVYKRHSARASYIAFITLGLNPGILLWCTSLRWYSFFVPILIWCSIIPQSKGIRYWAKCFGGLLILGYIGYTMFIIAIPLIILYWNNNSENTKIKLKHVAYCCLVFLVLYSYQLYYFFTIHIHNSGDQYFSVFKCIIGFYISQISSPGVFPISFQGIITSIGLLGIFYVIFISEPKKNLQNSYFIAYTISAACSIATKIAGKFRNLVIISPWQALCISTSEIKVQYKKLFTLFLSCLLIGYLCGDYNIVTHQNTSKNDYNLPIKKIIDYLKIERLKNKNDILIISHNPTIAWNLYQNGFQVIDPYLTPPFSDKLSDTHHSCLIYLKTWQGALNDIKYKKMQADLNSLKYSASDTIKIGRDKFFKIKQFLDARYPEYTVEIIKYSNVEDVKSLNSWLPN